MMATLHRLENKYAPDCIERSIFAQTVCLFDFDQMSKFPLEPSISKMLIQASTEKCLNEVITIAAMLSVENIW